MTAQRNRALCCECGHLRTFSPRYSFHRDDSNYARDGGKEEQFGWRMTGTLRCSVCKAPTRHALLRDNCDPLFRDVAEARDRLGQR
jgi:hypothetical protein